VLLDDVKPALLVEARLDVERAPGEVLGGGERRREKQDGRSAMVRCRRMAGFY
jgi:hypothetical protein